MNDPLPVSMDSGNASPSQRPSARIAVALGASGCMGSNLAPALAAHRWRVIELCAYWHPAGLWGLLYWYAHLPLYGPLVRGAVAEIARRAELAEAPRSPA